MQTGSHGLSLEGMRKQGGVHRDQPVAGVVKGLHVRVLPLMAATHIEVVVYPTLAWNTGQLAGSFNVPYPLLELPARHQVLDGLGQELQAFAELERRRGNR